MKVISLSGANAIKLRDACYEIAHSFRSYCVKDSYLNLSSQLHELFVKFLVFFLELFEFLKISFNSIKTFDI